MQSTFGPTSCLFHSQHWPCVCLQEAYGKLQEWTAASEAASHKLSQRAGALQEALQVCVARQLLPYGAVNSESYSQCARHQLRTLLVDNVGRAWHDHCHDVPSLVMQSISSQAQASAAAEDGKALAGSGSRPNSQGGQPSAAAAALAGSADGATGIAAAVPASAAASGAAANEVMDQLAGLQQLVHAEAHKQQEVFDSTLKVRRLLLTWLRFWTFFVVAHVLLPGLDCTALHCCLCAMGHA